MRADLPIARRGFLKLLGAAAVGPLINTSLLGKLLDRRYLESTFLMYHEMSAAKLKRDLGDLIRRGYQPISLETLAGFFAGDLDIPPSQPTFLVTCDDGLTSQYEAGLRAVEYIEKETGWFVPLTFFVMTKLNDPKGPIDEVDDNTPSYADGVHRYMTKGQLISLISAGHRVENHTVNHPDLTRLNVGARNADVEIGEQRVEALWRQAGVPRKLRAFAYPYGRYQGQAEYISGRYDVAFSTISTTVHSRATLYSLGRKGR